MLARGLNEEQIDSLHGPIGIDLGGGTPEEIALGLMAEIVAARHGRAGTAGLTLNPAGKPPAKARFEPVAFAVAKSNHSDHK